ncbi:unnamed protein product [Zymoseptoria tritici ST99CH_3D1]|nr:unnamed protein product [Zymoseptoria tritici ST99CH_3D1]
MAKESRQVVGAYYPSWRIYRDRKPSDLRLASLTHVYYAFARIKEDGSVYTCTATPELPWMALMVHFQSW